MFKFSKLREGVYELRFNDSFQMCMTFLRYQEFYESPRYHDKKFTIAEFMTWYSKEQGEDGHFSYASGDWGGFNIPVEVIKQVFDMGLEDPNQYDQLMYAIYRLIKMETREAYLIGVMDDGVLDVHEMTHAMFYLDHSYRDRCLGIIHMTDPELLDLMREVLFAKGYTEKTFYDEVQAYLTEGGKIFEKSEKLEPFEGRFQDLQAKLKAVHDEHYPRFIKDIAK